MSGFQIARTKWRFVEARILPYAIRRIQGLDRIIERKAIEFYAIQECPTTGFGKQ
jgi:hypothetical protein